MGQVRGSSYLRYAIMTATSKAIFFDPYFGDYYDSMIARGQHHYVAVSGVARALWSDSRALEGGQALRAKAIYPINGGRCIGSTFLQSEERSTDPDVDDQVQFHMPKFAISTLLKSLEIVVQIP